MVAMLRRKKWLIATSVAAVLLCAGAITIGWLNSRLTRFVESDQFRRELEKETSKGLHFEGSHYAPIHRTGTWTAECADFTADNGRKAMKKIDAHGITGSFNPWGIFRRLWQIDRLHIQSGEVAIQVYEPKPEPSPAKPWYAVFLPERVYLNRVESEPLDVTWLFREKRAGFFGTRLLITPHGRDFEYQARGGELKVESLPELRLRHTHLLITKTLLELYQLELQPSGETRGSLRASGKAGTRDDRRIDFKFEIDRMPIADWLPDTWAQHVSGVASGNVLWRGENPKLESAMGEANLSVVDGYIQHLPFLEKLATITGEKELGHLRMDVCSAELEWHYPSIGIKRFTLEEKEKFRAEGEVAVQEGKLHATIQLGVARRLLAWLPKPEEVFPRENGGYLWTAVHLSGTIKSPQQDLSPRIVEAIKESPTAALSILFRQFAEWLKNASTRE
ncbi:MAG: hypothetical protein JWO45_1022 [Spartobacteria bacterium]|nr:hypothetical protein [Spartobacteria bacterium]